MLPEEVAAFRDLGGQLVLQQLREAAGSVAHDVTATDLTRWFFPVDCEAYSC